MLQTDLQSAEKLFEVLFISPARVLSAHSALIEMLEMNKGRVASPSCSPKFVLDHSLNMMSLYAVCVCLF